MMARRMILTATAPRKVWGAAPRRTTALAVAVLLGGILLIAGAVHRVLSVSTTWAGDRPALFRLHVRR